MPEPPDPVASDEKNFEEQKRLLKHHATVVREYAKWSLLRNYRFTEPGEAHRRDLIEEFFSLGSTVQLSQRDMVLMLLGGLFLDS